MRAGLTVLIPMEVLSARVQPRVQVTAMLVVAAPAEREELVLATIQIHSLVLVHLGSLGKLVQSLKVDVIVIHA